MFNELELNSKFAGRKLQRTRLCCLLATVFDVSALRNCKFISTLGSRQCKDNVQFSFVMPEVQYLNRIYSKTRQLLLLTVHEPVQYVSEIFVKTAKSHSEPSQSHTTTENKLFPFLFISFLPSLTEQRSYYNSFTT